MQRYSEAAWERAMTKKLTWWQAAEIVGISAGRMRRAAAACRTIFVPSRARGAI